MSKELLKQALDALETYKGFIDDAHIIEGQWHWIDGLDNVQTAIKEYMAQPQEPAQFKCTVIDDAHPDGIPLEKWASPPQRTWVGLTDEEQTEIMSEAREFVSRGLLDLVEAKLKEKNT